jgi:phosphoribosylformylglycinamidine synthase
MMHALKTVGFNAELVHINELINKSKKLENYQLLALPGGFADGDYLGSGKMLANRILYKLGGAVADFAKAGNLVLGVCNGFQVMVKMGLLPSLDDTYKTQESTLISNTCAHLLCQWEELKPVKSKCIFTKGIAKSVWFPIAHGEGRFIADNSVLKKLESNEQIVFKYAKNPNGSMLDIAGICDQSGRVFGLMPHPERAFNAMNDPRSLREKMGKYGDGYAVFKNAFEYAKAKK